LIARVTKQVIKIISVVKKTIWILIFCFAHAVM
jgi:hypothetical protein